MNLLEAEIKMEFLKIYESKTNHVLHLILSIVTGGLWVVVWIFVTFNNADKREMARDKILLMVAEKQVGEDYAQNFNRSRANL